MSNVTPIRAGVEPKRSQMDDWRPIRFWGSVDEPAVRPMTLVEKVILFPTAITLVVCAAFGLKYFALIVGYFA